MQYQHRYRIAFATTQVIRESLKRRGGWFFTLRACVRAFSILKHLPDHLEFLRVSQRPSVARLIERQPRLIYRYLWASYLAHRFSPKTRLKIATNHYRHLADRVTEDFFSTIYDASTVIWQEKRGEQLFRITLSFPRKNDHEGDLRLVFECNSVPLYLIIFTIVDGRSINTVNDQVLLVTTLQGLGELEDIKQATRQCRGIAPIYLLLAAAEGIALALDIRKIGGMGMERHISNESKGFLFNYDEFWSSFIGEKAHNGFYLAPVPFPGKPLNLIKSHHRSRALRSRWFRDEVRESAYFGFKQRFLRASQKKRTG